MSRRFYSSETLDLGQHCLQGPEAHHLIRVMRAKVGDEVVLFDGEGDEYEARVSQVGRNEVEFEVLRQQSIDRELACSLEFAVALPRGDRSEWLTQKLVELGATRLTPWQTKRSVALPNAKTVQRLERQVIEASKQCGRNRLMSIAPPESFDDFINADHEAVCLFAHPARAEVDSNSPALPLSQLAEQLTASSVRRVVVGIGPEGGFTHEEVQRAQQHRWQPVDLGARILRTETAAMAIAAWLMLNWAQSDKY